MVEKVVDIEVKASVQPLLRIREIDSRCPKGYKLRIKIKPSRIIKKIETRISLPKISFLLIQVSFRLKPLKRINAIKERVI